MKVDIRDLSSDPIEKDLHGLCSRTIRLFYKDDLNIDVGTDLGRVCLFQGVILMKRGIAPTEMLKR